MSSPLPIDRDLPVEPPPDSVELPLDAPPEVRCPKCDGGRLIDPEEMGYCPICGYCRYVEEARQNPGFDRPKQPTEMEVFKASVGQTVAAMPGWVGVMLGGIFAIIVYLIALDSLLAEPSYERAMAGLVMMIGGLVTTLACQFWALLKVAPRHQELAMTDSFLRPGQIWHAAVGEMPATRWPVWLAAWGLSLALGAALFVGGQSYWVPDAPPNQVGWWE
jgi:hypothetical protein